MAESKDHARTPGALTEIRARAQIVGAFAPMRAAVEDFVSGARIWGEHLPGHDIEDLRMLADNLEKMVVAAEGPDGVLARVSDRMDELAYGSAGEEETDDGE